MSESRPIPFAAPGLAFQACQYEIESALLRVARSGWYVLGNEVDAFEKEFAKWLGAGRAIGVANGTDAIAIGLLACGIGPGDRVATVANTVSATVSGILSIGATPVLCEVCPERLVMSSEKLSELLGDTNPLAIKAVVPVHLYGTPVDMPALMKVAQRHGLKVVEDCAQAHGASCVGKAMGTWGHAGAFSFYPTKNLGALGDGGAVVTSDPEVAERARLIRQYGWRERYVSEGPGMNSRLDEMQAAVLRARLPKLAEENRRRREIATDYDAALSGFPVELIPSEEGFVSARHQYPIRLDDRDGLAAFLKERGLATAILYPTNIHRQPGFSKRVILPDGGLALSERSAERLLCLPIHPYLSDNDVERVVDSITLWFERKRP